MRKYILGGVVALGVIALLALRYRQVTPSALNLTQPYALWEAGLITEIRNCDSADAAATFVACAELNCRAAVARQLPNPAAAVIGIGTLVEATDIRYVRIVAPIQYATSPPVPLPKGYECQMEGYRVIQARILH